MNTANAFWASHDAGALPWLAVAGYLAGTALCLWQRGLATLSRARLFWLLAGLVMLTLGINKQLDLQTPFTAWGRQMAWDGGWYADRRAVQQAFILGTAMLVLAVALAGVWAVRGLGQRVHIVLIGLCLLGLFVILRAASFHHFEEHFRLWEQGLSLHIALELVGIAIVFAGAAWPARRSHS